MTAGNRSKSPLLTEIRLRRVIYLKDTSPVGVWIISEGGVLEVDRKP